MWRRSGAPAQKEYLIAWHVRRYDIVVKHLEAEGAGRVTRRMIRRELCYGTQTLSGLTWGCV